MARSGISKQQIFEAAEKLHGAGEAVSHRTIRNILGSGSPNNIHKHLNEWKLAKGVVAPAKRPLSSSIIAAINAEVDRVSAELKRDLEFQIQEEQQSANLISQHADALEVEINELHGEISLLASARDRLEGRTTEQATEIERLRTLLDDERALNVQAQRDIAVLNAEKTSLHQQLADAVERELKVANKLAVIEQRELSLVAELAAVSGKKSPRVTTKPSE